MPFSIEITSKQSERRFFESAKNIAANTEFGIQKALWRSGKDLMKEFSRQVLAKDKTGRLYIRRDRSGRGRRHIASAPGETPANRTGAYRRGIGFNVDGAHQLVFGNSTEHALPLEVGTLHIRPRPGLSNTIAASERDIIRNLSTAIEDEI